ncbi:MAG: UxaA family hydrolase [Acuticoccus sp.]
MSDAPAFAGYRRADGRVGVRNDLLVLSTTGLTGAAARRIGAILPSARVVAPPYGSGVVGGDGALRDRLLTAFATHPNVGAVILLSGKPPEGAAYRDRIAGTGKPVTLLVLDEHGHDTLAITDAGVRAGTRYLRDLSEMPRSAAGLDDLVIAAECGRSDPSSGLAANPLVGLIADRIAAAGGSFVAGETMEWFGAEHLLEARAADASVAAALRAAVARRMARAAEAGIDLIGNNPGPTNIAGGLTTLEEKSLGAVLKTGSGPIAGLIGHGEAPPEPGLWLMDQPFYAPESVSGLVASGAQMVLFTTGPGNSYASLLAPTIKLSANADTVRRLPQQIDFDASDIIDGCTDLADAADRLMTRVLATASGGLTFGEILGEGEEVLSRAGASL